MGLRERFENFTNGRRASPPAPGFLRYLAGWTFALAFVFSFAVGGSDEPVASAARFGYWFMHVGTGLLAISVVSALLQRGPVGRLPAPLQLALYGLGGALVFTPIAILFETWLPVTGGPDGHADWLADAASDGWWRASLAEFSGLAPSFLGSWLLINFAYVMPGRSVPTATPRADSQQTPVHEEAPDPIVPPVPGGLCARLPRALGVDVIHLRADLNYLHVTTADGSAMILYSLARAAEEFGDLGLVVHRAHWVACAHVSRSRRTAQGLVLTLSNGTEVPVSRRRQAEVRARFGDSYQSAVKTALAPTSAARDSGTTTAPVRRERTE